MLEYLQNKLGEKNFQIYPLKNYLSNITWR